MPLFANSVSSGFSILLNKVFAVLDLRTLPTIFSISIACSKIQWEFIDLLIFAVTGAPYGMRQVGGCRCPQILALA